MVLFFDKAKSVRKWKCQAGEVEKQNAQHNFSEPQLHAFFWFRYACACLSSPERVAPGVWVHLCMFVCVSLCIRDLGFVRLFSTCPQPGNLVYLVHASGQLRACGAKHSSCKLFCCCLQQVLEILGDENLKSQFLLIFSSMLFKNWKKVVLYCNRYPLMS